MPVRFEGFPRLLDRSALRPGRWFLAGGPRGAVICFATAIGVGAGRTVLTFRAANVEGLEFAPIALAEVAGGLSTIEDELVFAPGDGPDKPWLFPPSKRPFMSGSLLRLRDGDLGVGYAERVAGEMMLVSLSTGEPADGFEMVFDRWSLSLRRGEAERLIGCFRTSLQISASR